MITINPINGYLKRDQDHDTPTRKTRITHMGKVDHHHRIPAKDNVHLRQKEKGNDSNMVRSSQRIRVRRLFQLGRGVGANKWLHGWPAIQVQLQSRGGGGVRSCDGTREDNFTHTLPRWHQGGKRSDPIPISSWERLHQKRYVKLYFRNTTASENRNLRQPVIRYGTLIPRLHIMYSQWRPVERKSPMTEWDADIKALLLQFIHIRPTQVGKRWSGERRATVEANTKVVERQFRG